MELSIREGARIARKKEDLPIKRSWLQWSGIPEPETVISPFGKIQMQTEDMAEETGVVLENIEHEFSYSEGLYLSRRRPEYWDRLGSSKSRTEQQKELSRELITQMLDEVEPSTLVAFTDGSCQPNPGPCGAGACLYLPRQDEPVKLTKPVTNRGSILLGELVAILMTLQYIWNQLPNINRMSKCLIMSDSQSAVGILTLGWEATSYGQTIQETLLLIKRLEERGVVTAIEWTPGHAHIAGNEIADSLAKEGAKVASDLDPALTVTTFDDVKKAAHQTAINKWQHDWNLSE